MVQDIVMKNGLRYGWIIGAILSAITLGMYLIDIKLSEGKYSAMQSRD